MAAAIDRTPTASFAAAAPAAAASGDPLGLARAAATALAGDGAQPPLDATADVPDVLSTALARRAELLLLLARERDQTQQAKLDGMRSDFDNASAERSEQLREMNALRDMAVEQMKKDDEVLKKLISMI